MIPNFGLSLSFSSTRLRLDICLHCGLTYSKEGGVVGPKVNDKLCHSTHLAKDFVHLFPISPHSEPDYIDW